MKKGMTIFALTTILCGAAAITENHNQAFARSGSHSSGHSASSGRSSHSSGHSASSGRSSHSSGHSASSGRSSHSSGHSASSGRSSHSSGHSASSGRSSHSSVHSANSGKNSHSKGHSATVGKSTSSKGHSAIAGRSSGSKGHSAVVSNKSNSKGKNTNSNRNSKPSNVATKGRGTNAKTAVTNKNNKFHTAKNNSAKNNNKKSNALNNKANIKGKATNHKNQLLTSKKGNNSKTNKVTKNNKKNQSKTNLVSKRNQNKKGTAVNSKKNNKKNFKNNNLATKGKVVNPKKKPNLSPKVAAKKYKTKEEISKLSNWAIIKYVYQHRNGRKINELHGCYCGPFFGNTKKGPKPVDILDRLCRLHDIGYEKKGYFNRQVNNEFIAGVYKYASKMKPAEREKAFYFAEGFKRMNKTPLQEVAKAFNLASKPFTTIANFISGGAKAIGNLFNSNKVSTINNNTSKNFDRGGSDGKNLYPWLKKAKVAR